MDSPRWSLQESLDSPVFSLCETSDSLRESNCTLVDSFVGVFARVDSWTLPEILSLDLCRRSEETRFVNMIGWLNIPSEKDKILICVQFITVRF